jgi:prevent-host-death family protein
MSTFSVADAKNTLPRLIDQALEGKEVVITRHGRPVAELRPVGSMRNAPASVEAYGTTAWLRARTLARPGVGISSVELLNLIYQDDT